MIAYSWPMKFYRFIAILILALTPLNNGFAQSPEFSFPVDCTLQETCWIANYVDVNPAPDIHQDFKCNAKTYEGHKGTDIALRSLAEMKAGVDVKAAADGTVLRMRDGESDTLKTGVELQVLRDANKDCGNGVILDHGNGLLTYYCHMKNGSVRVQPKKAVKQGDILGQIGQSGVAEFPHLHFAIVWEGGHINPFTGLLKEDGCGKFKNNLWDNDIAYMPLSLYDAGFSNAVPDFKAIEAGSQTPAKLTQEAEAIVLWASIYQIAKGDTAQLKIIDPDGEVFVERTVTADKNRARQHYYTGKKITDTPLKPGTYRGEITLSGKENTNTTKTILIDVESPAAAQ